MKPVRANQKRIKEIVFLIAPKGKRGDNKKKSGNNEVPGNLKNKIDFWNQTLCSLVCDSGGSYAIDDYNNQQDKNNHCSKSDECWEKVRCSS
jgi:hypothetical protein